MGWVTDSGVPAIEAGWALFLDLDGTLLEIAPSPDAVRVPPGLVDTLACVARRLDGALAIVSGRARETIDALLAPLSLPGGFGHGAELRDAAGRRLGRDAPCPPPRWHAALSDYAARHPGLLLEAKPHGLALHYRAVPDRRDAVRAAMLGLLEEDDAGFDLLPAHMAFELRPRVAGKGRAVDALMATRPFAGRRPVFVGDDVTDEEGMQAARALGGLGLHVGRDFTGGPAQVRAWLARAAAEEERDAGT